MELVRMSQIRSPSGWAIMYSESHYACFGCQRALAPADPRRALKKDGAGQFGRTRLFFTLCQVEQSNRRPQPWVSPSSTLTLTRPPTLGAPRRAFATSGLPPLQGTSQDGRRRRPGAAKKEEQMDEEDVQEAGRPTKQQGRPGAS